MVAVELEFYLIDRQRDAEGYLQPPCAARKSATLKAVYSVDNLNHFADVLRRDRRTGALQGIPADGAVAEARADSKSTCTIPTTCCRPAITLALKRLVRMVAKNHNMQAT
ncbi:hypothetical protein J4732_18335 [Serratia marcescens]|uniref:GS catalytic domain-containing protein n=1 Tax=Serratia marcescens TaxID=615 RepID=A0A939SUV4_SERMA|nr:hypothetical protein [Serratia marcescens]